MTRLTHLFLALSFAAMQCVAPLAHAHTAGSHEQGIHLPVAAADAHVPEAEASCCTIEADESPAVVVPEGKRKQERPMPAWDAAFTAPAIVITGFVVTHASPVLAAAPDAPPLPTLAFRTPYPHAPPASTPL